MTAFPWNSLAEQYDEPDGEPSHIHIPRPSRLQQAHTVDTSVEDLGLLLRGCTLCDD